MRDGTRIAVDVCLPRGLPSGARVPTILRQTRYYRRFLVRRGAHRVVDAALFDPLNAPMRALFTSRGYAWVDVDVRGSGASFGERPCPWWLDGEVRDGAEIVDFIVKQPWSNGRVGSTGNSYDGTTAEFLATNRHEAVRAVVPRFSLFDVYADVGFPGGLHHAWFTEAWERANEALDRNSPEDFIGLALSFGVHGARGPSVARAGSLANRAARLLDRPAGQAALRAFLGAVLAGVPPVDDDAGRALLAAAIASHTENFNVHGGALHTTFRDDAPPNAPSVRRADGTVLTGLTSEIFSPSTYVAQTASAAVQSHGGWFDGAYANSAAKRHRALMELGGAGHRLLLGPWVHGGGLDMDPDTRVNRTAFDHSAELLRFFDRHLAPDVEGEDTARVRYYVMGEGRWRSSSTWPPEGARSVPLAFAEGRRLAFEGSAEAARARGVDHHEVDPTTGTGRRTRWRTLVSPLIHADGAGRSTRGLLVYETAPLAADVEVAGHPVLVLRLASSHPDGAVFAYLDDVDRDGRARLVTEGLLRTVHGTRLVETGEGDAPARAHASFLRADALRLAPGEAATHAIELLPVAMLFRRGHRIRLSLAGADVDHFAAPGAGSGGPAAATGPVAWQVDRAGSRLLLPVVSRP